MLQVTGYSPCGGSKFRRTSWRRQRRRFLASSEIFPRNSCDTGLSEMLICQARAKTASLIYTGLLNVTRLPSTGLFDPSFPFLSSSIHTPSHSSLTPWLFYRSCYDDSALHFRRGLLKREGGCGGKVLLSQKSGDGGVKLQSKWCTRHLLDD